MQDTACVDLLRWALPQLGLRWEGFRKVRRQVCRNVTQRITELGLADPDAYRALLERDPAEWRSLEARCGVTITRFWRDRAVWDELERVVLPELCAAAERRGARGLAAWSAGCASGEEPYSLLLLWIFALGERLARLDILATDADPVLLGRAARACYAEATLREVPAAIREAAFQRSGTEREPLCLRPALSTHVQFSMQDIRRQLPEGPFDLILCRNLAFTYFDAANQRRLLARFTDLLRPGGALVIGQHETLPEPALLPWVSPGIFRRSRAG